MIVVSAAGLTRSGGMAGTVDVDPGEAEEARGSLDKAQEKLKQKGLNARTIEAHGDPADMLVQQAKEAGADLIAVGTRGLQRRAARPTRFREHEGRASRRVRRAGRSLAGSALTAAARRPE